MSEHDSQTNQYFYDPATNVAIDMLVERNGVKVTQYSNQTQEQVLARYPKAVLIEEKDLIERQRQAHISATQSIDQDRFIDALECLPPSKWAQSGNTESFHICERITHDIVSWYVRIGENHYTLNNTSYLTHQQVLEMVAKDLEAQPKGEAVPV